MSSKQRDRGRILTPDGLSRLQQAIRAWELEHEVRCTQERIKELTSAVKEGGLDPGTTRKILKAKEGVDPESIRCLFTTFGLQLNEADLAASSRLQVQADPNFVGREGAIADLNTLVNRGAKVIVIQARGGVGKTTLARKYLQQEFGSFLEFPIAKETKDIASIESLIEEKLRQLGEEPGREFFVSIDRLKRKLQNERIGILIDNLEPALDAAGKLIEPHRRYVELLRVLADPSVQSTTLITSRERLNEYSVSVQHYLLQDLSLADWRQYFLNRFRLFSSEDWQTKNETVLAALHKAYGGNAKVMDILCGAILTDYAGNIEAYWQANQDDLLIERALEDLVVGQFDRLQQIDSDAYNLLCRMGCYRYQDVPTVPIEGLFCLLWDVPENRQRRVVKSLQDRSLVETEDGEYWLHPVIRGEAIGRLREHIDLEITNRKAAEFWTKYIESVETVEDAIKAFEPYYNYIEINDFNRVFDVITKKRFNYKFEQKESLNLSYYRLGLFHQIISAITQTIESIDSLKQVAKLYNILGNLYWLKGSPHAAIKCHEESRNAIIKSLNSISEEDSNDYDLYNWLIRLKTYSLGNIGFCYISLWELEMAREFLKQAISISEDMKSGRNEINLARIKAAFAFVNSYIEPEEGCETLASIDSELIIREAVPWDKGYILSFLSLIYRRLGRLEDALRTCKDAISFSEKTNYTQIKAVSICTLAGVFRENNAFESATLKHLEAISLLDRIGARCDLAEAYFELGLTYQAMNEIEKSSESFQEAICLFTEMDAPKQVERIRQSMQNEK